MGGMSDETCLEHDAAKGLDGDGFPFCVTCRYVERAVERALASERIAIAAAVKIVQLRDRTQPGGVEWYAGFSAGVDEACYDILGVIRKRVD